MQIHVNMQHHMLLVGCMAETQPWVQAELHGRDIACK